MRSGVGDALDFQVDGERRGRAFFFNGAMPHMTMPFVGLERVRAAPPLSKTSFQKKSTVKEKASLPDTQRALRDDGGRTDKKCGRVFGFLNILRGKKIQALLADLLLLRQLGLDAGGGRAAPLGGAPRGFWDGFGFARARFVFSAAEEGKKRLSFFR